MTYTRPQQTFFFLSLLLFFGLLLADFVLKKIVLSHNLPYICNDGIAMSIVLPNVLFITLWCGVIGALLYLWCNESIKNLRHALPYILIIAGACGNGIDRLLYGCVIDYIPLLNISLFNLADFFITLGALLLLVRKS